MQHVCIVDTLITENSKAEKRLGWKPKTTFEEGIRKMVQWYLKNNRLEDTKKTDGLGATNDHTTQHPS